MYKVRATLDAGGGQLWMQEMKPFADRGVKVGSAQVCWNMQWLQSFMSECKKLGCDISFIALHWYGSWRDFDKFTNWISTVHNEFGLPIWTRSTVSPKRVAALRHRSRPSTSERSHG